MPKLLYFLFFKGCDYFCCCWDSKLTTFPLANSVELHWGRYESQSKHRNWIQTFYCCRGHFPSFLGRFKIQSELDRKRRRLTGLLHRPQGNWDNELESCGAKTYGKNRTWILYTEWQGNCVLTSNRKWQRNNCFERQECRAEHTMLKDWVLMCFTIIEETSETLQSVLGSSGSLLEGKKGTLVIYQDTVILWQCCAEKQEGIV